MTKRLPISCLFLIFLAGLSSCDRKECKNDNVVFEQYKPETKEYKAELAKQLQFEGGKNLRYWYDKSIEINGKEYLELYIQNESLCAKGLIEVKDKSKRRDLENNKGYSGAELTGISIRTEETSEGINFVLENMGSIID